MGSIRDFTQGVLSTVGTGADIWEDRLKKEAEFKTLIKQTQLQNDMNNELLRIGQSGDFENWNTNISKFFDQVQSGMENPDSPYYCKNQIQADAFNKIIAENHTKMSYQVAQMAQRYTINKMQADYGKGIANLRRDNVTGDDFEEQANQLAEALFNGGGASPSQLEEYKTENAKTGYADLINSMFDRGYTEAIQQGKDLSEYWDMIEQEASKTNVSKSVTPEEKEELKKQAQIKWNARLQDIQQSNADQLEQIVHKINFAKTIEEKCIFIAQGQDLMSRMKGNELSMPDKRHYSEKFKSLMEYYGETGDGKGNGGNGNNKDSDSYAKLEALIKVDGATVIDMVKKGDVANYYDGINIIKRTFLEEFMAGNYDESKNLTEEQRQSKWDSQYSGQLTDTKLIDAVKKELINQYPTMGPKIADNFKKLQDDMNKNPKKYGTAALQDLSNWLIDTMMGDNGELDDKTFEKMFDKYINDYYIDKIKYVELNSDGKLKKTLDPTNIKDVLEAIKLSQNDYVYTWQGKEIWAPGKKEGLEAEGGVISTLKNVVAGTLGIPEEDYGKIGFYYKPDEKHNDLTSTPIITYSNGSKTRAFEVVPTADGKGFQLNDPETGAKIMDGFIPSNKDIKASRKETKKQEKEKQKAETQRREMFEDERTKDVNKKILNTGTMPNAVKAAGLVSEKEWEEAKDDIEARERYLFDTRKAIDKDARQVDYNRMSITDFKNKWGISYSNWISQQDRNAVYTLILNGSL